VTIGKGFAGVIKRYHFGGQNASHGNSISHRVPGSTGQNQSPAHVFKGKRMPGHLGDARRTISNLEIVRIDAERQLLLIKGSVPGSKGRDVIVRAAAKITKIPVAQPKPAAKADGKPAAKPAAAPAKPAAAAKPAAQPAKKG
jgi:large subunit ribosomal protein L3